MQHGAQLLAEDRTTFVGSLQLWDKTVSVETSVREIEAYFLADPARPGVIILSGGKLFGLLSRHSLLAALSKPFGRELFIKRSVMVMIKGIDVSPLTLSAETPIASALKLAMHRADPMRFEPLLVQNDEVIGLLDVPALLTAQAALLEEALMSKDRLIREIRRTAEELTAARQVAHHDATHDGLTGLPNRKLFLDMLEYAMGARRSGVLPACSVMFIDLDRFKIVNDSLGHEAGNAVLKEVAARLCHALRRDVASKDLPTPIAHDTVARLSGDEFAVLLVSQGSPGAVDQIAQRLLTSIALPFHVAGSTVHISASIGLLPSIDHCDGTEAILRDADIAMYRAKQQGKARAVTFEPAMREEARRRMRIESSLREAIADQNFVLHYQPIVDLHTGEVRSYEALVRWQRAHELVYPMEFIDVAEDTGLILPLGDWVFSEACSGWQVLAHEAERRHSPMVSINLSPLQFEQAGLCERLKELSVLAGVDPRMLTIEITERSAMACPDQALETFKRLKQAGFQIAIDDFGTGYSSLSYLHRFPIDVLKIDRSFIADIGTCDAAAKIVTGILALARSMDIKVTAEGIETASQYDWLRQAGCHTGQGYYFGRAVPHAAPARGGVLV